MNKNPRVMILRTEGTNCDEEAFFAFELAGGKPEMVHVNQLRNKEKSLKNFHILVLPGGFAYGDDVVSGKILAVELTSFFSEELQKFVKRKDTLTIGICNGFQVLVRTGLLPFGKVGTMDVTLTNNESGHFECRWVRLKIEKNSRCVFLNHSLRHPERSEGSLDSSPAERDQNDIVMYPVAHGEGKFFAHQEMLKKIEKQNLVVFRYVDDSGKSTQRYPENPNGSLNAIAAICDPTGRILGIMPHPERFVIPEHFPNWRRTNIEKPHGLPIFENAVKYVINA